MTESGLRVIREFAWGLLLVSDSGTVGLPTDVAAAPEVAAATRSALAINVRHATDLDGDDDSAEVSVNVVVGRAPAIDIDYRAELEVSSGVLEIGDADAIDESAVSPRGAGLRLSTRQQPAR